MEWMQPLVVILALCSKARLTDAIDPIKYFDAASFSAEGYVSWLASSTATPGHHAFLPTGGNEDHDGAAIFWSIDQDEQLIKFTIAVHAIGWVGLGLSQAGGMIGSDIVLFQSSNPNEVVDTHVVEEYAMPLVDDCPDWNLINSTITDDGEWMIVEVSRLLDTNDAQDWPIVNDKELWSAPTKLIAAWGDATSAVTYHGQSKARGSVRLFAEEFYLSESGALVGLLEEQSDGLYFEVRENDHPIPKMKTEYHDVCKTFEELNIETSSGTLGEGITIIGVMPVLSQETRKHVHHFTVYLAPDCASQAPGSMLYVWAPGHEGWAMPDHVGFPAFHTANAQAIQLEIHFDNPLLLEDLFDSSGVRFYYTKEEREEKAAILELGDPYLALMGEKINPGLTTYQFTCPGQCSAGNSGSVTILNELLHMHQTGVRMTNEVIRNDEIVHTASVDVFDFDQQGGFHVPQQTYEFFSGDGFRTTCYYRDGDKFGLDSNEEMCIAYVMYYPAKEVFPGYPWVCPYGFGNSGCEQELEFSDIDSNIGLGRSFGTSSECAVDSASPDPTRAPVSAAPTSSERPTVFIEPCIICPNGITADADYVVFDGASCGETVTYIETFFHADSPLCTSSMEGLQLSCCPMPAGNPCTFCSSGLTRAESTEVPAADGATCGDIVDFAINVEEDSETCELLQGAETVCCSTNNNDVAPCPFCPNGIARDEDFVIPGAPNGETCPDLAEISPLLDGSSVVCTQVQAAEIICCPLLEGIPSPTPKPSELIRSNPSASGTLCGVGVIVTLALFTNLYVFV